MNIVDIFKALGDENRIRILNVLMQEELCVCELETILDMTQSNASRHLIKLKHAGIVTSYKKSQWVINKIDDKFIQQNRLLYDYLKNEAAKNVDWKKDRERLNKYKSSSYTCEQLREDMCAVKKFLEG
ncbi:metalloregulator ArsR/SmtB family transcription factor [Petroclostridium sp. X23]|uniref:ArsR/SmtB family transcription factor n=1 Tax=Petroclostridium sp. X23 TaxID=3045146 RepID=UPI0024ACEA40|nr:metalloregulator ArsR/SmtB family transcription factor [Petroclostridium sp. X23]WHH58391.1 metalloregulator ArsR/SmtB family transcription factor [Petroclostridium sp. X23]